MTPITKIDFTKQFSDGFSAAQNIRIKDNFQRIVFCGVGGSAIPGEIISMLWLKDFNCYINRGFGLPEWVDDKCLVICNSWSGNTRETINSFKTACDKNIPVVAIARGGELLELAKSGNIPFINLPDSPLPTRFTVGLALSAILTLLRNSAIIDTNQPTVGLTSNGDEVGREISSRIGDKLPLIYSSYQWRYLARFWKVHFNENCKIHSFSNFFPEAAHNEISAFGKTAGDGYFPIIIIDPDEKREDKEELKKFAKFLKGQKIDHGVIELTGGSRFEKILKNYNLAVSVSVALALARQIDPFDTSIIENFKKA